MYGMDGEGGAFQQRSDFVGNGLNKANGRERRTVMVVNAAHVFIAIFHNVLPHCAVDTVAL